MNYTEIRKLLLKVFIGFLSLTAFIAILSVLTRQFGETQVKILLTTLSITAGSICALSCAGCLEGQGAKGVGVAGLLAAGVAVLLAIGGIWAESKCFPRWAVTVYWKTTATAGAAAVALALGCLLRLPNLAARYRWTQTASTALIGLLTLQVILAVWGEINAEGYYRVMAALSILVVLVSLVIPICSRLGSNANRPSEDLGHGTKQSDQVPERLVLREVSAGVFADEVGRRYQVTEIQTDPGDPPASIR